MDHEEVGRYWNENAEAWTELARAGYDVYRDQVNTPAFFEMLPDVAGLAGLDIGCGEGHNTRRLASGGARVTAVDISEVFVDRAKRSEEKEPLGIEYRVASAVELPFDDATYDFAVAFMSLMDIPELDRVLEEAHRVLRPGGFLQFSIEHPCFSTPYRRTLRGDDGETYAVAVGDYFRNLDGELSEWIFSAAPEDVRKRHRPFRTPRFTRTLSEWVNRLVDTGFRIERMEEPRPSVATAASHPEVRSSRVVAYFLHVRARKRGVGF